MTEYSPPLPERVLAVMRSSRLSYLATVEDGSPHLSLMNFTFVDHDARDAFFGCLVMSTRRDTKKFSALLTNPSVAVLLHDFDALQETSTPPISPIGSSAAVVTSSSSSSSSSNNSSSSSVSAGSSHYERGSASVTLYCTASVVGEGPACSPEGAKDRERLRALHLEKNADYPQFIEGPDIAILALRPTLARVCDIHDRVSVWNKDNGVGAAAAAAAAAAKKD